MKCVNIHIKLAEFEVSFVFLGAEAAQVVVG